MKPRFVLLAVVLGSGLTANQVWAQASTPQPSNGAPAASQSSPPPHLTHQTRMNLEQLFTADLVYIRTSFPMGKRGLTLKNGVTTPNGAELQQFLNIWGPAVKAGDAARITAVTIRSDHIRFEINGGPVKKEKWYQHISISGNGGTAQLPPDSENANPRGSYLDLLFDHYVPEMTPEQLKKLLWPVFDFNSKTALEAYLETIPPKAAEAIKNHQVLVGMNREMVIYSRGHPPKKIREKEGEIEHEDWIYGDPPQDVDFVRFIGDNVVRIETMKVDGTKMVRVDKEVDIKPKETVAKASADQSQPAPTLRRPGETSPDEPSTISTPRLPPAMGGPDMPGGDGPPSHDPGVVPPGPGLPAPQPGASPNLTAENH